MQNFTIQIPTKIYFGLDEEKKVGKIIKGYGFKNILIHYGQESIVKSGLLKLVLSLLEEEGITYTLLGGVLPNPRLSLVLEGVKICKEKKIDFVLAIGGGSVIDSAKLIASGAVVDFNPWEFSLHNKVPEKALKVGTILTLAAAGSEMSESCVISNEEGNLKRGFNADTNRALFSICNPKLTFSVGKYQTACGIVDILMHTLERYYSLEKNCSLVDNLSLGLFKSVIAAGKVAFYNPQDYEARATLMWASSLSHNGLTGVSKTVCMPVHQLEHELSGLYPQIAHGAGLAALYSSWCRYVYKFDLDRFACFAYDVMNVNRDIDKEEAAIMGIDLLEDFFSSLGMPTSLKELNVKKEDLELLARRFTFLGKRTLIDIKNIGYNEALDIYKMAY